MSESTKMSAVGFNKLVLLKVRVAVLDKRPL